MRIARLVCQALLLLAGSCAHGPAAFQARTPEPPAGVRPCPETRVDTAGWRRHTGRFLRFSVLLPPDAVRRGEVRTAGAVGEAWSNGTGLQMSYDYSRAAADTPPGGSEGGSAAEGRHCVIQSAGAAAEVRISERRGDVVPGYSASALWRGNNNERLTFEVIWREPGDRDAAFAILRSVDFHE